MSIHKYLEEMKSIQNDLLEFLNDEAKEPFDLISNLKINLDRYKLKSFLHLLVIIFTKIEKILIISKDDIKKY